MILFYHNTSGLSNKCLFFGCAEVGGAFSNNNYGRFIGDLRALGPSKVNSAPVPEHIAMLSSMSNKLDPLAPAMALRIANSKPHLTLGKIEEGCTQIFPVDLKRCNLLDAVIQKRKQNDINSAFLKETTFGTGQYSLLDCNQQTKILKNNQAKPIAVLSSPSIPLAPLLPATLIQLNVNGSALVIQKSKPFKQLDIHFLGLFSNGSLKGQLIWTGPHGAEVAQCTAESRVVSTIFAGI
ncbi:Protein PHYLLO, chloroplastic [Senna tora]|uniref:Protein PHYLLO, chloroplastic n=1 Tax=Senna tora TaxID=362788 RepID=A0A834T3Z3_9FABA|nr:Protein PHYLLO, chloroplastic [Senna tora]